jgi:cullin 1
MALYTVAYNYCTSSRMHGSLDHSMLGGRSGHLRLELSVWAYLSVVSVLIAGANLMGSDLYNHLIRYFNSHLVVLRDVREFCTIL